MATFILCHKCAGLLEHTMDGTESFGVADELHGCKCMSGWIRGFEPALTIEEALTEQHDAAQKRIKLYRNQGRKI